MYDMKGLSRGSSDLTATSPLMGCTFLVSWGYSKDSRMRMALENIIIVFLVAHWDLWAESLGFFTLRIVISC